MLVRAIVQSLLVLSTFVLGGSVATGRYCLFAWATVVGYVFVCMVHDRWIEVAWQPRVIVGDSRQMGGESCGDTWSLSSVLEEDRRIVY